MLTRRQFFCRMSGVYILGSMLAACGVTNREPDYTVTIRHSISFEPSSLSIPLGSMVAWHNQTDHVHTITSDPAKAQMPERITLPEGVIPFDSGDLYSGQRWVYTFDTPGTYVYFCRYHEIEETLGVIVVTA